MVPSIVAPTIGPCTTPSRSTSLPGLRVNSTRRRVNWTPLGAPPGAPLTTLSSPASPRTMNSRMLIAGRRIHRQPHLPAEHLRVGIGEAEQGTGIVGFEIDHLAVVAATAQVTFQWRID